MSIRRKTKSLYQVAKEYVDKEHVTITVKDLEKRAEHTTIAAFKERLRQKVWERIMENQDADEFNNDIECELYEILNLLDETH